MGEKKSPPFSLFGHRLQSLRKNAHESLLEVSSAVEIDAKTLERIEAGQELPDEDILMLLISHFDVQEGDALKLWELAGYSKQDDKDLPVNDENMLKQIMMVIPFDNRIAFTDAVQINAQKNGVVLNFAQSNGNPQPQVISRIGMSVEQAQELVEQLNRSLETMGKPKVMRALPAPKSTRKSTDKKKSA